MLSAFALAQPLFDILGKNAEFFAVRGSTASEIVLFALAVTFVPALALLALELVVFACDERAGLALHVLFVVGLTAVFAVQALQRAGLDGTLPLVAGSLASGAAAGLAFLRFRLFRTFLAVLAPAPLVFLAAFLFGSPVRDLVFASDVEIELARIRADAPVVFVVFDELPEISLLDGSDRVDEGRFPNFARLARDATWFRNATTLSSSTTAAVPSLLSSDWPWPRRLPVVQNHPHNLFTLLGGRYHMNVTESQTRLCPSELCERASPGETTRLESLYSDARIVYFHLLAPPALEDRLPSIDDAWGNFGDAGGGTGAGAKTALPKGEGETFYAGRVRDFNRFLRSLEPRRGGRPTLNFLHVLLPHGPWLLFPDGRASRVGSDRAPGREGELWWDSDLALQAWQRHLLQLGYTDRLLGRLLARLRRTGMYRRSLVVVTADHGISFRGGDKRREPTRTNLAELAFIPLFVKAPGQEE
ncbi:MAG: sulfatase-like hydrolase/transferase, partial [Thermoleophilia bacterium]|nr:sulfatase-like hydrolase/transferase [Thermoleophilia bacterium]